MTQAIAKTEAGLPAAQQAWGAEGFDRKDILIPKILLMQGLSQLVGDEKAVMGDMINSVTHQKMGDKTTPVEVIPLTTFKTWVISEKVGAKYEYRETVPMTSDNQDLELEETVDGVDIRRDRSLNFFVLLASESGQGDAMPYLLSCRRTSYTAGKKLVTHFAKAAMMKLPPASKTFKLTCRKESKDGNAYYLFDIEPGRTTKPEELQAAFDWFQQLKKGSHKVDESDLKTGDEPNTDLTENSKF